jgi:plastocyanin
MALRTYRATLALIGAVMVGWTGSLGPTTVFASDQEKVVIKDFTYVPMSLTVKAGTTVTWINMDDEPHAVASDTGLFRSGALDTHETYSFKFDKPGTYQIHCSIHSRMVATINVE